jgi:glycine/D-amino acid oxidase-like deaminating enzyme
MLASRIKRVGVIGAGMVGICAASWLQRDGHSVFLVEEGEPGRGASFGNAGCLNGSSVPSRMAEILVQALDYTEFFGAERPRKYFPGFFLSGREKKSTRLPISRPSRRRRGAALLPAWRRCA